MITYNFYYENKNPNTRVPMKKIIILMLACAVSTPAICMKRAADPQWQDEFDKYEKKLRETGDSSIITPKIQAKIRPPKKSTPKTLPHFRYNKYGKTEVYVRLAIYSQNDTPDATHTIGARNLYCTVNPNLLNITEPTEYPITGLIATILPLEDDAKEYFEQEKKEFEQSPIIYTKDSNIKTTIDNLLENKTLILNDSLNAKAFYYKGFNLMSVDHKVDHGPRGFETREKYDQLTANNGSIHRSIQQRQITGKLKNSKTTK